MVMILAAGRSKLLPQASGQGRKTVAIGQRVNFLPCLAHGTILDKTGHTSGENRLITGMSPTCFKALKTAATPCVVPP